MHQVGKRLIVQRVNQVHLGKPSQLLLHDLPYLRVLMHRENDFHILELIHQAAHSPVHMAHRLAQVFPAMSCQEHNPLILEVYTLQHLILKLEIIIYSLVQGINDSIAGHKNPLAVYGLSQKILL